MSSCVKEAVPEPILALNCFPEGRRANSLPLGWEAMAHGFRHLCMSSMAGIAAYR